MVLTQQQLKDMEYDYCHAEMSVGKIAQKYGVSNATVFKRAKVGNWKRGEYNPVTDQLRKIQAGMEELEEAPKLVSNVKVDSHALAERLLCELDAVTSQMGELTQLIKEATNDDTGTKRLVVLQRAVSLKTRSEILKNVQSFFAGEEARKHAAELAQAKIDAAKKSHRKNMTKTEEREEDAQEAFRNGRFAPRVIDGNRK